MEKRWRKTASRVIRTNLQAMDIPRMSTEQLTWDMAELEGNTLAVNVGGIYAWYQSKVLYHHTNEWLPKERDLLGGIVRECRKRRVEVIARLSSSEADDSTYLQGPQQFVRNPDGTSHAYGIRRTGSWNTLYSTCIDEGYRSYETAVPVPEEVLKRHESDRVFLNAPNYEPCFCESRRKKYRQVFGEELPMEWENGKDTITSPTFAHRKGIKGVREGRESLRYKDNIKLIRENVQAIPFGIPLILYFKAYDEDLDARVPTADMLCVEA